MLAVLSPAKKLDFTPLPDGFGETFPEFQKDATKLARIARKLSVSDLRGLMSISEDLATLNKARFKGFQTAAEGCAHREENCLAWLFSALCVRLFGLSVRVETPRSWAANEK